MQSAENSLHGPLGWARPGIVSLVQSLLCRLPRGLHPSHAVASFGTTAHSCLETHCPVIRIQPALDLIIHSQTNCCMPNHSGIFLVIHKLSFVFQILLKHCKSFRFFPKHSWQKSIFSSCLTVELWLPAPGPHHLCSSRRSFAHNPNYVKCSRTVARRMSGA